MSFLFSTCACIPGNAAAKIAPWETTFLLISQNWKSKRHKSSEKNIVAAKSPPERNPTHHRKDHFLAWNLVCMLNTLRSFYIQRSPIHEKINVRSIQGWDYWGGLSCLYNNLIGLEPFIVRRVKNAFNVRSSQWGKLAIEEHQF